jgi:hypothetical protein
MAIDLKHRAWGTLWNKIFTVLGGLTGFAAAAGQYLDMIPEQYRSQKWYGVAAALVALGLALGKGKPAPVPLDKPVDPPAPPSKGFAHVGCLIAMAAACLLVLPAAARASDELKPNLPATLCMIGSSGNWCYGFLPTVTAGFGVDVRHGEVKAAVGIGASIAGTWMPGQLKSVTIGLHSGFDGGSGGAPMTWNVGGSLSFLKGYATVITDWQAVGGDHAVLIIPALSLPL